MPAPNRAEILRRAKEAFLEHGPGFVVVVEGRDEPHYGLIAGLRGKLADEPDAATLIAAAEDALDRYDPESEAVVIEDRAEGVFVLILAREETRMVGESDWTTRH